MPQTAIENAILAVSKMHDGQRQLSCARAHVLAEDLDVPLSTIGQVCEAQRIKITDCQLGCFGRPLTTE